MRVVNVKELKARLSQYLREVGAGEVFLVTDRSRVVARLGPATLEPAAPLPPDPLAALLAAGTRPPLRRPTAADYVRSGSVPGRSAAAIDALLDDARAEDR